MIGKMSGLDGKTETVLGGQAVIEGVMMRSLDKVSIAVRKQNGKILVKGDDYTSFTKRKKFFKIPFIRGGIVLLESLYIGVKSLSWSSRVAIADENNNEDQLEKTGSGAFSSILTWFTVFAGVGGGILLFFYFPLLITDLIGIKSGFYYNLVDSLIRIILFISYIILISKWKEIQRVFEYHGSEHKNIFSYENGDELTIENAKKYTTHHPRCGTSFIGVVIIVSFIIFALLGRPDNITEKIIRLLFIPVIGGISYELIKMANKKKDNKFLNTLILPGLWFQNITTKEPDEDQLKVGLVALKSSLGEDLKNEPDVVIFNESSKN